MNVKSTENQIIRVCDRSTLALFYESFGLFDSNQPWIRSFFSFLLTSHIYYWDICKIAAMLAGCHIFHDYVYPFGILQTWEGKVHNCTTSIQCVWCCIYHLLWWYVKPRFDQFQSLCTHEGKDSEKTIMVMCSDISKC